MNTPTTRTLHDRHSAVVRQLTALGRDPGEWDLIDLALITQLEGQLELLRDRVIYGLRNTGFTDAEIGEVLGVTRQAVSKRWPGGGRYVGAAGRYRPGPTVQDG